MTAATSLDELLGRDEPHATFHDAELLSVSIDHEANTLVAMWRLCVGDPSASETVARERTRDGTLILEGLAFLVAEPPSEVHPGPPWLTADGPIGDSANANGRDLAQFVPAGGVGWYLYFSDSNSFAYWAARSARFQWV
jgi:hypothetical protein